MKKTISYLLLTAFIFCSVGLQAQTADEIVNKYIDAIGGKDKIKAINSIYTEGSINMMGNESPLVITVLNGKGYKTESEFNNQKIIQCFTDKGGWAVTPMGSGEAMAMPDDVYKEGRDQINTGGPLFDYAARGSTVTLQGKEADGYKLLVVNKDKVATTLFIDPSTYYITRILKKGQMMGQEINIVIKLSDYKKNDSGYTMAYQVETAIGEQFTMNTQLKKIEINKAVDPAVFTMPGK